MDSTDHTHLQHFCEWRNQNKTIGLGYIKGLAYIGIFHLNLWQINETKEKYVLSFGSLWRDPKFTERKTFGFVPNERVRHQFHLKLICFWINVFIAYSLNFRGFVVERRKLITRDVHVYISMVFIMFVNILLYRHFSTNNNK